MIGIPLGLLYANASEWLIHKHLLHGNGRNKKSFWSFHWHEHHGASRRHDMIDKHYEEPLFQSFNAQTKEAVALVGACALHLPLAPVAPFFVATVCWSAWHYRKVHRKAHLDPEWGKQHMPWHYDHHMGPNQDANWCVTHPLFDQLLGTREAYLGTERADADAQRRAARQRREAAAPAEAPAAPAAAGTEGGSVRRLDRLGGWLRRGRRPRAA